MKLIFVGSNHNLLQMANICWAQGIEIVGIIDQDYWNTTSHIDSIPVIGSEHSFNWTNEYSYFIATNWAPGNDPIKQRDKQKRQDQIKLLKQHNVQCINLIHPTAIVPKTCKLGSGIMICANSIIGNNCQIGDYCQLREHSYMAHNAKLNHNVVIQVQSYIGADVTIGNDSYIGIKASIIPRLYKPLAVPSDSFIKAHSLITGIPG